MKFEHIDFTVVRNGEEKSHTASGSGTESGVLWTISSADDRFSLTLAPSAEIGIKEISASFEFEFLPDDRLFLNGYQSWTDSREYTVNDRMRDLSHIPAALNRLFGFTQYGDYNFVKYGKKKGQLHGFSYAYVRRGDQFILLGSLAENTGYTVIRFDAAAGRMILQKDCAGRRIAEPYAVFDLVILRGTENAVFDKYFELMGIPKATGKRLTGYTSWYNRYENITEQTVLSDLDGFKNVPQTPDVFQIDDGYESAVGDWLSVDPVKFPGGMGAIARRIADAGMLPGIWLAPFAAEKDSRLAKDHPDWLLKDETGQPVPGGGNWSGFYGLDIYNEGVRGYLKRVFAQPHKTHDQAADIPGFGGLGEDHTWES